MRSLTSLACAVLSGAVLAAAHGLANATDVAILDRGINPDDQRRDYATMVLHAVMERTRAEYGPYRIEQAPVPMERPRLLYAMRQGRHVNIVANQANAEWQAALRSVPVPVDLGLYSWRLLLIDAKNQPRLRELAASGRLAQARAGVANTWVLRRIFTDNGYGTVTGNSYDGMFYMLQAGRFDYLPRAVNDVFREYDTRRAKIPGLAVDDSILLHIRVPTLFYISPGQERLQRRVAAGMEAMLRDGSLERLMLDYYRHDLERARLCGRIRFDLRNAELDPAMQARRELWFDPFEPRHGLCPAAGAARRRAPVV